LKLSGSAPYLSWSASCFELFWVKLPLICVLPPLIGSSLTGAEMTLPSRVNAT